MRFILFFCLFLFFSASLNILTCNALLVELPFVIFDVFAGSLPFVLVHATHANDDNKNLLSGALIQLGLFAVLV